MHSHARHVALVLVFFAVAGTPTGAQATAESAARDSASLGDRVRVRSTGRWNKGVLVEQTADSIVLRLVRDSRLALPITAITAFERAVPQSRAVAAAKGFAQGFFFTLAICSAVIGGAAIAEGTPPPIDGLLLFCTIPAVPVAVVGGALGGQRWVPISY